MEALALLTAKQALQNTMDLKAVKAILFRGWLMPTKLNVVDICRQYTKDYAEKTKNNKGHNLGTPDMWVWRAFLTATIEALEGDGDVSEDLELLKRHAVQCTPALLKNKVPHARLAKTAKDEEKRLEIHVVEELTPVLDVIGKYLVSRGAREIAGKPPKGDLERKMQQILDDLK